jgi:hypothetical protein
MMIVEDPKALGRAAADLFVVQAVAALKTRPFFTMALSGGKKVHATDPASCRAGPLKPGPMSNRFSRASPPKSDPAIILRQVLLILQQRIKKAHSSWLVSSYLLIALEPIAHSKK